MTSRITELEQSLAASEARVVELERERDRLRECIKEEMKYRHLAYDAMYAAEDRTEAAESAASTAMRDGMLEAARIADERWKMWMQRSREAESRGDVFDLDRIGGHIGEADAIKAAIRTRASSLPGGEGKVGDDDPYRPEMVEELLSLVGTPAGRETRKDGEA